MDNLLVEALAGYERRHGYPPSLRELAQLIGRGTTATYARLLRLRGWRVDWVEGTSRTWRVLRAAEREDA
jgi:phosphoglycolate phosphatase-like HAD superfamily hydrolase